MAFGKQLKNISVSHLPGQVGVSLDYTDAPSEHILLPLSVATKFRDKFTQACELALHGRPPGDDVALSDGGAMRIFNPKEH